MRARSFGLRGMLGLLVTVSASPVMAKDAARPVGFNECKTFFQTNSRYDPRIGIATDAVVVHRHGEALESLRKSIGSWKAQGFVVGRMFFADSDATNAYWKGKWDGVPHEDEVERDAKGRVVLCAGIRPYMLPTEGWMRHLEEMTRFSIEAGADAILPEEPLAHTFTGYEAAFKPMFEKRFGLPWQPESASPEAHFLTCQLKTELYLELEQRLARLTREEARQRGRRIDFLMPVHPLYSNRASRLVAPMGMGLDMEGLDGYVGQVWTGPVNWSLANYGSPEKSFFTSAYALYDYFAALTAGTDKKMWLLADPVEDDPNHQWSEFEEWYRHCLVAKLMFGRVDSYEVMPWPDRIFLPGHQTGGGTPAPEAYRISLLSAIQVQQEIPAVVSTDAAVGSKIGIACADTALWESPQAPVLDGLYGLILPLLHEGIRPTISVAERWTEPGYLDRFRLLVLSYENFKPHGPAQNAALVAWVKSGGVLLVLGGAGEMKAEPFWWTRLQHASPLAHLLAVAGVTVVGDSDVPLGKGLLIRRSVSPRHFAAHPGEYVELISRVASRAVPPVAIDRENFSIVRGPFRIVHALRQAERIAGPVVDVFDPDLPVLAEATLPAGQSRIYRDVSEPLKGHQPAVLHCTHRLMEQRHEKSRSRLVLRGPAETPGVVRYYPGGRSVQSVTAASVAGEKLAVDVARQGETLRLRFPNVPEGVVIEVTLGE